MARLPPLLAAVATLHVGSPRALGTSVGPLLHAPAEKLVRALTTLDEGESWLLKPRALNDAKTLWTPGIKIGVRRGSLGPIVQGC